tara:strand:+ start:25095 stop:25418 length:324 start_codon:yes stop_codon:yes gene_type:complete
MGGKGGSKGVVRDKLIQRFLDEHEGPFTVSDTVTHMKGWGLRNIPTVREIGMMLRGLTRKGVVANLGQETTLSARMMAEKAGLTQSQLRKTTLYIKVGELAKYGEEE